MSSRDLWVQVCVPPRKDMISHIQDAALRFAQRCGFEKTEHDRIELAIEEAFCMVLHYSYPDGDGEIGCLLRLSPPFMCAEFVDHGAPFDFSMIPDYKVTSLQGSDADAMGPALSYHLLKHCVDQCRIIYDGRSGMRLELSWFLPGKKIFEQIDAHEVTAPEAPGPVEPVERIGEIGPEFAIQVARLMYQGYGYSYVYEDVYYPSRIHSHYEKGRLKSWGAVTASGQLVGHLALMREAGRSAAVEWGLVVVNPAWRGKRITERMLEAADEAVRTEGESVFYAHAVTAHPYTQKACDRLGFYPSALFLCYAPATLSFREINPELKQRESTFIAVRLIQPPPPATLYIPAAYDTIIKRILQGLEISESATINFCTSDAESVPAGSVTSYQSSLIASVNGAMILVKQIGENCDLFLRHEMQRLCNERVDVIYLTMNLEDPGVNRMVQVAETRGFFLAGVTPQTMGVPYGLTYQYMNNLKIDEAAIYACEGCWQELKTDVMQAKSRVEGE